VKLQEFMTLIEVINFLAWSGGWWIFFFKCYARLTSRHVKV